MTPLVVVPEMEVLLVEDQTAVRDMLPMMMAHPVEILAAARQVMAPVPVVAVVVITTAILVLVALVAEDPKVAPAADLEADLAADLEADLAADLEADRETVQAMETLVIPPQVMAVLVMVPRTTVRVVANLALTLHMPLIVAFRLEASLEEVWLMPPIEIPRRMTGLAMALMLLLTVTLPAGETSPSFGLLLLY